MDRSTLALSLAICLTLAGTVAAIQLPNKCGNTVSEQASSSSWRIVGGQLAKLGQWPWQVYLNKTISYQTFQMQSDCGGAIISKDWILTAAHCVYDTDQESIGIKVELEAIMGTIDLNTKASTEVRRKVVKVIRHENFDYENKKNDIALLKLSTSLDLEGTESHLHPACVPKLNSEFFENCRAIGFGYQDSDMNVNDYKLRSVAESILDHSKCNDQFLHYNKTFNLCIGGVRDKGTCKGDSGSPYVCHHQSEAKWYQMGLVSYGIPCALENVPDVLTNVGFFYDWILKQNF